jgi:hypothetical protein
MITYEEANELLEYVNGFLFWKKGRGYNGNAVIAGSRAGSKTTRGYRAVFINGKKYAEHRLVWLLISGEWPDLEIDHIDRNKTNNKIENLRLATRQQNTRNNSLRKRKFDLPVGVHPLPSGRFRSLIQVNKKTISLGSFDTIEQASASYKNACVKHFGEFSPV